MYFRSLFVLLLALQSWAAEPPTLSYWHVWTDNTGATHQTRCKVQNFAFKSIEPPASPQWLDKMKGDGANVIISVLPVGWTGPWHENPMPQWIVPLSGRWFVETSDGKRSEMGPGEISFGEDQNSKPGSRGRIGHLSGTVGNEPAVLMIVQLKDPPTLNEPCHFK